MNQPPSTKPSQTRTKTLSKVPSHAQVDAATIYDSVHFAAVGMSDAAIRQVVDDALVHARRALSS